MLKLYHNSDTADTVHGGAFVSSFILGRSHAGDRLEFSAEIIDVVKAHAACDRANGEILSFQKLFGTVDARFIYIFRYALVRPFFEKMSKIGLAHKEMLCQHSRVQILIVVQIDIFDNGIEGVLLLAALFIVLVAENGVCVKFPHKKEKFIHHFFDGDQAFKVVFLRFVHDPLEKIRAGIVFNYIMEEGVFVPDQIVEKIRMNVDAIINGVCAAYVPGVKLLAVDNGDRAFFDGVFPQIAGYVPLARGKIQDLDLVVPMNALARAVANEFLNPQRIRKRRQGFVGGLHRELLCAKKKQYCAMNRTVYMI